MAMESFGRLGEEMDTHLAAVAEIAIAQDLERGLPRVQWLRKWGAAFSVGAARCVADCIDAAVVAVEAAF